MTGAENKLALNPNPGKTTDATFGSITLNHVPRGPDFRNVRGNSTTHYIIIKS